MANLLNYRVDSFDLKPGKVLSGKYEVLDLLGTGWEGEVYKVKERSTGIERAAKLFYPQRNIRNKASITYARKLHKLYHCPIIIQYHCEETVLFKGQPIVALISELVEGELLSRFLERQRGKRVSPFQAIHLLHSLVVGLENIHRLGEYHGDLHPGNIIIRRLGLSFDLKLLDLYYWKAPKKENIQDDICQAIRVFYDAVGGQRHYANQPPEVKFICAGLKRSLILKRFPRAAVLRGHLETMQWS
jgi:serine/threonine protein kinase